MLKYEVNFDLEICLYPDACRVAGQLSPNSIRVHLNIL